MRPAHDFDPARIVGVIDLLGGQAVAARGGQRDTYKPIASVRGDAQRLISHYRSLGIERFYLADLDSLQNHRRDNLRTLEKLAPMLAGGTLWMDANWSDSNFRDGTRNIFPDGIPILSAETFPTVHMATKMADEIAVTRSSNSKRHALGLDYRRGEFVGDDRVSWMSAIAANGCSDVVVLDLSSVGAGDGGTTHERCRQLRESGFRGTLISGGGVQNAADQKRFIDAGCDAVLIGTAIHPQSA
ncbi:MAG: HisA/HisF-related TIM barrel protein [Planctomycetota bacterium]